MLTSPDIVPVILDGLDWSSKGQAACVCRQWRHLAGSAEANRSAGKCWLIWRRLWPPEGAVLRHVQRCKLALCTDRLYLVNFRWPQLPALTAVHIEARLTATMGCKDTIYWNNETVRDLFVTVLRSKRHQTHRPERGEAAKKFCLALGVASSCLETLCVRAVVAETGRLDHEEHGRECVGVYIDLKLASAPSLRHLLVCSQVARVRSGQKADSRAGDRPTVSFSGLQAAFMGWEIGVELNSGAFAWGSGWRRRFSQLQDIFQLCKAFDTGSLRGGIQVASDRHTMQLLQMYFECGCHPLLCTL